MVIGEVTLKKLLGFRQFWRGRRERRLLSQVIEKLALFDRNYYVTANPDVARTGIDPLTHYLRHGWREGRAPSPDFNPQLYLDANPDVAQAGVDPVLHYVHHGHAEGRPRSIREKIIRSDLFDPEYYRTAYLDVALSDCEPLQHFVDYGRREGRRPSLDFDPCYYRASYPDLQSDDIDPILHYVDHGRKEGRRARGSGVTSRELPRILSQIQSSGLFDQTYYLRQCPVVREAGVDPLLHYFIAGFVDYIDPSPVFSTAEYLLAHPDIKAAGVNPLLHLLQSDGYVDCACDAIRLASIWREEKRTDKPDDAISLERMAGVAYLSRFQFCFAASDSPGEYTVDAIADLVCRSPKPTIERIEPDVSIIIPVYGQLQFVMSCLDSLSRQQSRFSLEIIVADDASPEIAETWRLQAIPWVRYRRRVSNAGFIDNCNEAAQMARGRFLVLLNSDIRVAKNWLDELIGSFELFPKAGLMGSKLYNDDGRLQEAGSIYWRDGSAWNYGHNDDPSHPKYSFARQVDYVSGASVAVPTDVWNRLGGFDITYRPAYCEDADFAFRLRAAGYETWLQPLSQVVHYEGKTHGRDLESGGKAHQRVNMRRFARRWKATLAKHRPNGLEPDQEANRAVGDRILVLDSVTPMPDQDSGSFITFKMLRALQQIGYQITFVPQHSYAYDKTYTNSLQRLGIECIYSPHFHNIGDVLDFRNDFDIVLGYRYSVLQAAYDEVRRRVPTARMIFHYVDLHFLREEREAVLQGSRKKRIAAAMTKAAELELVAQVDCTIVHTKTDSVLIKELLGIENIVVFPYIAETHRTQVAFENRHDLIFLGGFAHPPNVDAVKHFVQSIWPLLAPQLPEHARFLIVGAAAPPEIQSLNGGRILVTGYVEDLQPYFETARVLVAPLRYGAGIKGKVIQSLCYGTPSVISPIAAEGIGLVSGRETIISEGDEEFADQVMILYSDSDLWHSVQAAGYKFVEENFSWDRCLQLCRQVLDVADETWLARHERQLRARLDELVSKGGRQSCTKARAD